MPIKCLDILVACLIKIVDLASYGNQFLNLERLMKNLPILKNLPTQLGPVDILVLVKLSIDPIYHTVWLDISNLLAQKYHFSTLSIQSDQNM